MRNTAIVVGAGIVGLAHARALAQKGFRVTVIERHLQSVGASIRNFGMVWPVGQPDGVLYNRAMRSRAIWKELCIKSGIWHSEVGSLHVATLPEEVTVMRQLAEYYSETRGMQWLDKARTLAKTQYANKCKVLGALWSPHEMIVEAREAIPALAAFLQEEYKVHFIFGKAITRIEGHTLWAGEETFQADQIFVCSGADFETLYPEVFANLAITKCKLQMMRLQPLPAGARLGASLCGGLSLIHYKGFEPAPALAILKTLYEQTLPAHLQWGIHVMACENSCGELTIGDTHESGLHLDPFDKHSLNQLVLQYLGTLSELHTQPLRQTWNGTYAKMSNGQTEYVHRINDVVTIVNGLGGAGMTLSFGLAEEVVADQITGF